MSDVKPMSDGSLRFMDRLLETTRLPGHVSHPDIFINHIRSLRTRLAAAEADANWHYKKHDELHDNFIALQATAGKQQKLADGVPAVNGMRVYFKPGYNEYDDFGTVHVAISHESGFAPCSDAYSTPEAAESALKQQETHHE